MSDESATSSGAQEQDKPKNKSPFTLSPITKKKYNAIKEYAQEKFGQEEAELLCQKICEIFDFDPVIGNYAKEKVQKHQEWRDRRSKELGVPQKELRKGVKNLLLTTQS